MTQDGENAATGPTLFERWKRRAQENPFVAVLLLVFAVVVGFAAGWQQVTGEPLWVSVESMLGAGPQSYEECVDQANEAFVEIMKCKEFFGARP